MRSTVHLAKPVITDMVAQVAGGRFMPDAAKAEMHRKMAEPGSAMS